MYISVGQYKQCIPAEERESEEINLRNGNKPKVQNKKGIKGAHENEQKERSFERDLLKP